MKRSLLFAVFLMSVQPVMAQDDISVVASIRPLHSLVAAVMQGGNSPHLLVAGGSPHAKSLRPSQAKRLSRADVVFWIGGGLEGFLVKPLAALSGRARVVALADLSGLRRLAVRKGGVWEGHDHASDTETTPGWHRDRDADPHVWLDPQNARTLVKAIAAALAGADPAHGDRYKRNAVVLDQKLVSLEKRLAALLLPVKDRPYIVFHDAYHHFEARFGLHPVGAISVDPGRPPGVKRIRDIRQAITNSGAGCVFSEPQFEPKLVQALIGGTSVRAGVLDPLGSDLKAGPELYFQLMEGLAGSLKRCLQN